MKPESPKTGAIARWVKTSFPVVFAALAILSACSQKRFEESDVIGNWKLVGSGADVALELKANNRVIFKQVSAKDVGLSSADPNQQLPPEGRWSFDEKHNIITFRFVLSGVTYDHSAGIDYPHMRLYFTIGDPDLMNRVLYEKE